MGDVIPLPPGEGVWRALDAAASPPPDRAVSGSVRPGEPGLYEFAGKNGERKIFAVNAPTEESDLAPWPNFEQLAALESTAPPAPAGSSPVDGRAAPGRRGGGKPATLLVVGAGGLRGFILAELALANRTAM